MNSNDDKIFESYQKSQQLDEFIDPLTLGVAGAAVAGAGEIGSGAHNRVKVAARKFLSGRGGALSQLVGKAGEYVGGAHYSKFQATHEIQDSVNYLWNKIQGLMRLHPKGLTGDMDKNFIKQQSVTEGGPKINIDKLTTTKELVDGQVYAANDIRDRLIPITVNELFETGQTGADATVTKENFINIMKTKNASAKAAVINALDVAGHLPPKDDNVVASAKVETPLGGAELTATKS